ncbi:MAG: Vitamin B12 transporter BtuB precursor [Betaproteobacteria bacterium ADurb.Bin341]|nr:MAG: Vitamin B12 transporter BtuB precursor [Betaproteobacteria bacterium ADurb.Bin341]
MFPITRGLLAAPLALLSLSTPILAQDEPLVVLTASRYPSRINELTADVTVVDREQLNQQSPSATLGEVLGRVAGVEFSRNGGRGHVESLYVRGSNTGHVLILVDGLRVGSATLGMADVSAIPLSQIERIEIVRGAASALYGTDAIGGVIQIITRPGTETPKFEASLGAGSRGAYETRLAHAGQYGHVRYALKAGGSGERGINAVTNPASWSWNPDRDGYHQRNFSGQLSYSLGKQGEIGASLLNARRQYRFDSSWPAANLDWRGEQTLGSASVYANLRPLQGWQSSLRLGQSSDRQVTRPSATVGQDHDGYRTRQKQITWQNDVDLPLGRLLAVLEHLEQRIDSTALYTQYSRHINSAALGWSANTGPHRWQLNIRHDRNSQFGSRTTETVGYGYQIAPQWRLTASYGTAFKAPSFNDLYYPNTAFVGVGNPALQPEQSKNREVGLHFEQGSQRFGLALFRNDITNLIQWQETFPGSWFYTPVNVGRARITGATAEYSGRFGAWSLYANATAQNPRDATTGRLLIRRAKRYATLGAIYEGHGWQAGAEWKLSSQRYDDADNTRQLGGYGTFSLHGRYALSKEASLFARADNIFDKRFEYARSSTTHFGNAGTTLFLGINYHLD